MIGPFWGCGVFGGLKAEKNHVRDLEDFGMHGFHLGGLVQQRMKKCPVEADSLIVKPFLPCLCMLVGSRRLGLCGFISMEFVYNIASPLLYLRIFSYSVLYSLFISD